MLVEIVSSICIVFIAVFAIIYCFKVYVSATRKDDAIVSLAESMKIIAARKENSDDQKN